MPKGSRLWVEVADMLAATLERAGYRVVPGPDERPADLERVQAAVAALAARVVCVMLDHEGASVAELDCYPHENEPGEVFLFAELDTAHMFGMAAPAIRSNVSRPNLRALH